jgi:hypothetical protein
MDLLPETSQPFRADERSSLRVDGKGKRMQLDVHALSIPDVRLIRTPRFSDARGYFCESFSGRTLPRKGLISIFCRTISRVPSGREPFAACTFNGRLSLKRSWFVCCAGAFSMSLSIFAARHQGLEAILA